MVLVRPLPCGGGPRRLCGVGVGMLGLGAATTALARPRREAGW